MEFATSWLWWFVWWPIVIGLFAVIEGYALRHKDRQWTLSRTIAWVGVKFPLSIAFFGMLFGGLLVHFFWHFCPDFTKSQGLLTLPRISLQGIFATPAEAHDYKHPDLDGFYGSLSRPGVSSGAYGATSSCCSTQDCHTTEAEVRGGEWWARIGKPIDGPVGQRDWELKGWVKVPPEAIVRGPNGNPVKNEAGDPVICHPTVWKPQSVGQEHELDTDKTPVFCFVPGNET
jgi:hypothetical protein